jgi:hypothetical protein
MYYTLVSFFILLMILYKFFNKMNCDMIQLKKEHFFIMENNKNNNININDLKNDYLSLLENNENKNMYTHEKINILYDNYHDFKDSINRRMNMFSVFYNLKLRILNKDMFLLKNVMYDKSG